MPRRNEAQPAADPIHPRGEAERILIVSDGENWFIQHVYFIERKLDFNRKVYHCDRNLGGPFASIEDAAAAAKQILCGDHRTRSNPPCAAAS